MDIAEGLRQGFNLATTVLNLNMMIAGALLGTLIGALPRLRAIHGVAVFLPLTYAVALPVESTLIFLVTIYYAAEFGSQRSVASVHKPLAGQGKMGSMMALSGVSSFFGGMMAVIGLMLSVWLLKQLAVRLGPAEYFVLVIFAFASLSISAGNYPVRTLISTVLGLMLATIGIDSTTGVLRFALDIPQLFDGIEFTTVVVGLFVISEIFVFLEPEKALSEVRRQDEKQAVNISSIFACKWAMVRASVAGFVVGLLPGAGTTIASSFSSQTEKYLASGDRDAQTLQLNEEVAAETANSAAAGGAMVPMLALGIPGSGTTAILLGALLLHNITPGPGLFNQHADLVWGIAASMFLGNLFLLVLNLPFQKFFLRVQDAPNWIIAPCLLVLAFIGVFSVNESSLSLFLMVVFGLFAYLLRKWHYPLVPLLLGFVLGELMENNLRRALAISGGDLQILYFSPISKVLWTLTLFVVLLPLILRRFRREMASEDR